MIVLDGADLPVQDNHAVAVIVSMGTQEFQTNLVNKPVASFPHWSGFYTVTDNSNRLQANELNVVYADAVLKVTVVQNILNANKIMPGDISPPTPIATVFY